MNLRKILYFLIVLTIVVSLFAFLNFLNNRYQEPSDANVISEEKILNNTKPNKSPSNSKEKITDLLEVMQESRQNEKNETKRRQDVADLLKIMQENR